MRHRSFRNIATFSGLTLVIVSVVIVNDVAAGTRQLVQRFGDSAILGFNSPMVESPVQRFDSHMRHSLTQRFESTMPSSPVQGFNSHMLDAAIQTFESRMMDSPTQRIAGLGTSFRAFRFWFYPIYVPTRPFVPATIQATVREIENPPEPASRPAAPPLFISLRCAVFAEMTVGKSEILSEKEEAPCTSAE